MEEKGNQGEQSEVRWNVQTKRIVALVLLVLMALLVYQFRVVIPALIIALLVAFILNPIVTFLTERLHFPRILATILIFLLVIVLLLGLVASPVPGLVAPVRERVESLQTDVLVLARRIEAGLSEPVEIAGYTIDLSPIYAELESIVRQFLRSVAQGTIDVVIDVASGVVWLLFILTASFYLVKDADRLIEYIDSLAPPGYRDDFVRLRQRIETVWGAFLRGQLFLGLVVGVVTTVIAYIIGLPFPPVMGLFAGVMEVIPGLGPALAQIPAILAALMMGSSRLPMSNFWFAVLVFGIYAGIQQLENNLLVPRILGSALHLHPLVVFIGVVVGGNLGGILGVLLAAPTLATLQVVLSYVFSRLYDRDPFAEPEEEPSEADQVERACRRAWCQFRDRVRQWWEDLRRSWEDRSPDTRFRPARPGDRPAVEAISAQIWDGDDYVPEVWAEWLADPHGEFVVAERGGNVVAFAKLSRLGPDEWWLEGLRVDPAHRGRGIATRLHDHLIERMRQIDNGQLRFGTHAENAPIHHLAERDGFRHVATYRSYRADPLSQDDSPVDSLRRLTEDDLYAAWALVQDSARRQAAGGLYEEFWQWRELTRPVLTRHLAAGDVWGLEEDGDLVALALTCRPEGQKKDKLFVGYVDGTDEALPALLRGLRGLAARQGHAQVRVRAVQEPSLLDALQAAGYAQREESRDLWIFELDLEASS